MMHRHKLFSSCIESSVNCSSCNDCNWNCTIFSSNPSCIRILRVFEFFVYSNPSCIPILHVFESFMHSNLMTYYWCISCSFLCFLCLFRTIRICIWFLNMLLEEKCSLTYVKVDDSGTCHNSLAHFLSNFSLPSASFRLLNWFNYGN